MQKKYIVNRIQVRNVEIWIEETLNLLKARGVITENIFIEM